MIQNFFKTNGEQVVMFGENEICMNLDLADLLNFSDFLKKLAGKISVIRFIQVQKINSKLIQIAKFISIFELI
jgi:hypothetical protein